MENQYCYIYCRGILGVRTNMKNFKWVYGSAAPTSTAEEYEKCAVKFDLCVLPERKLANCQACDKRFQAYTWNDKEKTIYYRRKLLSQFEIGYNIKICRNRVEACIGERYLKYVKNRVMNLHGVYYLLSDLANILLLKSGYLTVYGSAVYSDRRKQGLLCFAPPNTGKTITAVKLCETYDYALISEDVLITDGTTLFACPWTKTYRKKKASAFDSGGLFGKEDKSADLPTCVQGELTHVFVLASGLEKLVFDRQELLRKICILNGYLFQHCSSPIIKILAYFDNDYNRAWAQDAEQWLTDMTEDKLCMGVQAEDAAHFHQLIYGIVIGENI